MSQHQNKGDDLNRRSLGYTGRVYQMLNDCKRLPAQPIDATHALNRSAGVSNPNVLRGRSFNWRATALSFACECNDKLVPFGKTVLANDWYSHWNLFAMGF